MLMNVHELNKVVRQENQELQKLVDEAFELQERYEKQFEGVEQSEDLRETISFKDNDVEMLTMKLAYIEGVKSQTPVFDDLKNCYLKDMKNLLCQFDLVMKYFQSDSVSKDLIDNYEAIKGSLEILSQSLGDCKEYMSGQVESALSDIAKGLIDE